MPLGPSGTSMLEARSKICRSSLARSSRRDNGSAPTDQTTATESSGRLVGSLQKFFNAAMDRYLAEEREANKVPATTRPQHQGSQDVDMESIRSSDHGSRWDYDPDDTFPLSHRGTSHRNHRCCWIHRFHHDKACSDLRDLGLKEFTGKDQDEDQARAWISKV
ncbi:LOW QUALITY PROTEIN: hypothetical protein PHMEG_00014690, partial [Phytophthora megakarya]